MSPRLLRPLGGLTATAVMATVLAAQPAPVQAREADRTPNPHFNSSVSVDIEAGGSANITSPSLSNNQKNAKIDFSTSLEDLPGFEDMALTLMQQPSPAHRIVSCAIMSSFGAVGDEVADDIEDYEAVAQTRFLARLYLCVQLAQLVAYYLAQGSARMLQAGSACGQTPVSVKEKITKSGGMFHLTAKAATVNPRKMRVKIKCTVGAGGKISTSIKPKRQRSTLRKALGGKNIGTGIASPPNAADGAKVKVKFRAP